MFDDTLASDLAGEDGQVLLEELHRQMPPQRLASAALWFATRARFVEDTVAEVVDRGTRQYVILGAGLDSFAYRRRDLLPRLKVFEVDHPATQRWKRQRLAELSVGEPAELVFVPVDFEQQSLPEQITLSGFRSDEPVIVSWMAVTQYLTREAVSKTLGQVADWARGSHIVFTYDVPRHALEGRDQAVFDWVTGFAAEVGESFVSLFEPSEIDALLLDQGFVDVTHLRRDDLWLRYPGLGPAAQSGAGVQRVVVATKG